MQLKKQIWKRTRAINPCLRCGKDHETKQCVTLSGARRPFEIIPYGNTLFTIAN